MDLMQNEDYAADSCAISPTAFLLWLFIELQPTNAKCPLIL